MDLTDARTRNAPLLSTLETADVTVEQIVSAINAMFHTLTYVEARVEALESQLRRL